MERRFIAIDVGTHYKIELTDPGNPQEKTMSRISQKFFPELLVEFTRSGTFQRCFYLNGLKHRPDGPAVFSGSGT